MNWGSWAPDLPAKLTAPVIRPTPAPSEVTPGGVGESAAEAVLQQCLTQKTARR